MTGGAATTAVNGIATAGGWTLGTTAGANSLTASATGLTDATFHATGTADSVDHLALTPATSTITADLTQSYSVEGFDQYNNSLGNVTGATTLSVDGLPCIVAICAEALVGSHTVTGSMLGATGTATLNVTSGAATKLVFSSPDTSNLALGATRGFHVDVEDAEGNVVTTDSSTSVTYSQTAGLGAVGGLGSATASSGDAAQDLHGVRRRQRHTDRNGARARSASVTFTVDPAPVAFDRLGSVRPVDVDVRHLRLQRERSGRDVRVPPRWGRVRRVPGHRQLRHDRLLRSRRRLPQLRRRVISSTATGPVATPPGSSTRRADRH